MLYLYIVTKLHGSPDQGLDGACSSSTPVMSPSAEECLYSAIICTLNAIVNARLYFEAIPEHATLVFGNEVLAFLLRVRPAREEHAFVARGLFVFANAAGLCRVSQ